MMAILIILGTLCLGYYLFLQFFKVDFAIIWLLAFVCLYGTGGWIWWSETHGVFLPVWCRWLLGIFVGIGFVIFLAAEILIASQMTQQGEKDLDYIIVLGAQVKGDRPSRALNKRIIRAAEYLQENPETIAILSGGQGPGEYMTEAECMRRGLVQRGIDSARLILEDKSTSTKENLIFSSRLVDVKNSRTGLVTQNFHIYRSLKLARYQNYKNVCGIAAPSEAIYQPHFLVREGFALVKEKLVGNI